MVLQQSALQKRSQSFNIQLGKFGLWLLLLTFIAGCKESHPIAPPQVQSLPSQFTLRGDASGSDAEGNTVTCNLDLIFDLRTQTFYTPQLIDYKGIHGGEVFRKILARDGSGFAFFADVFGEVKTRLITHNGQIQIDVPINETADGRFWRGLAHFDGFIDENGHGFGNWSCGPLDIDQGGYLDTSMTVPGFWQIEPIAMR